MFVKLSITAKQLGFFFLWICLQVYCYRYSVSESLPRSHCCRIKLSRFPKSIRKGPTQIAFSDSTVLEISTQMRLVGPAEGKDRMTFSSFGHLSCLAASSFKIKRQWIGVLPLSNWGRTLPCKNCLVSLLEISTSLVVRQMLNMIAAIFYIVLLSGEFRLNHFRRINRLVLSLSVAFCACFYLMFSTCVV